MEILRRPSSARLPAHLVYFEHTRSEKTEKAACAVGQGGHASIGICGVWGRATGSLKTWGSVEHRAPNHAQSK